MLPKLLTIAQVAELKGRSRTSVYNAIKNGKLPVVDVLGRHAVMESDALRWNSTGERTGRPKGTRVSDETKRKISEGQKKRWQQIRSGQ